MKKKIILAVAAVMVMGLAIATVAYTRTSVSYASAAADCCKGDKCPMKSKAAEAGETAPSCEHCDCCKHGSESCPMKKKSEASAEKMPDSCPMKKGEAATAVHSEMKHDKHEMKAGDGKNCSCCNHKEKKDAPAV